MTALLATMLAPAAGIQFQVSSGARYAADGSGYIFGVPTTDIKDLLASGCIVFATPTTTFTDSKTIDTTVYALLATDHKLRLLFTSETEVTLIVPFGLPLGYENREIIQMTSAGDVVPTADAGVAILSAQGFVSTSSQSACISLIGIAQDVYLLTGEGTV